MDADYKKRILKELELFPLWKLRDKLNAEAFVKVDEKPIEADLFFSFRINYEDGSLLLLCPNFPSGTEEASQELFLNIAKFVSMAIGINIFQKNHLLKLTKDELSDLFTNTTPKSVLAFGLNNQFFEEYKTKDLMNNVTMNVKYSHDITHLLENPKDKKLVWESILDLIKVS